MRIVTTSIFIFIGFLSFGQTLKERERIMKGFESKADVVLELVHVDPNTRLYDHLKIQSNFLDSLNIEYRIIGHNISALNESNEVVFSGRSENSKIPQDFLDFVRDCETCKKIKIGLVTINWFTGTYTIKMNESFEIN